MLHLSDNDLADAVRPAQLRLRTALLSIAAIALLAAFLAATLQTHGRAHCLASLDRSLTLAQADVICGRPS